MNIKKVLLLVISLNVTIEPSTIFEKLGDYEHEFRT